MKIGILITSFGKTGIDSTAIRLANGLLDEGCAVQYVVMNDRGKGFRSELNTKVEIITLACPRLWSSLPALFRYLRREQPDAMISAGPLANGMAGWAKRLTRSRVALILTEHGLRLFGFADSGRLSHRLLKFLLQIGYRYGDAVVGVSKGVAEQLRSLGYLRSESIHVIHNPVWSPELEIAPKTDAHHPWFSDGNNSSVIVAVGRLAKEKGFDVLLKALAIARRKRTIRLIILGEGEERNNLSLLATALGVADLLDMPGFVENPQRYMARASLFVLSSHTEALPTVIIEALACGTPVVSTDCSTGPREILGDDFGLLTPPGDAASLARSILAALDTKWSADSLRGRARDFSIESAARTYLKLITGIVAANGGAMGFPRWIPQAPRR